MRKTIAAMMAQGMSLEDIHMQMEQILNEEYNKREQEQKELEIAAARDRVAHAFVDYINLVLGDVLSEPADVESAAVMLDEATAAARMKLEIMTAFDVPEKVEIKKVDADSDDEAIRKFLMGLGFQPMN